MAMQASPLERQRHGTFWMPLPLCHQLAHACSSDKQQRSSRSCQSLQTALQDHAHLAVYESDQMLSRLEDDSQAEDHQILDDAMD